MNKDGYEFIVRDHSLLLPYYARWLWDPLTERLPTWMTPNQITFASNICSGIGYALLLCLPQGGTFLMAAVAVLNFVYFTLDNIDGRQARRTGTCSALGEFLDHWFDAWNLGLLVLCLGIYFEVSDRLFLATMVSCSLGFFMTYWDQYRTGSVELGYVGPNEGLTAVSVLFALGACLGKPAIVNPFWLGLSLCEIFCSLMALGFFTVVLRTGWRQRRAVGELGGLVLGHGLTVIWYATGHLSLVTAGVMLVLLHAGYSGHVLACRLQGSIFRGVEPWLSAPSLAGLVLTSSAIVMGSHSTTMSNLLAVAVSAVMGLHIAFAASTTVVKLRGSDCSLESSETPPCAAPSPPA